MYRKPRRPQRTGILNLDSLMDILSCLVGVMLFMVIYTVLELGSTAFELEMPPDLSAPAGAREVTVLATGGTVRVLDTDGPLRDLLRAVQTATLAESSDAIAEANRAAPTDRYFRYSLEARERFGALGTQAVAIDLRVDELPGAGGDSVQSLGAGSTFAAVLGRLDAGETVLEFAVDSMCLDVFRQARALAGERGFATRWNPWSARFPLTYSVSANGVRASMPRGTLFKPQR